MVSQYWLEWSDHTRLEWLDNAMAVCPAPWEVEIFLLFFPVYVDLQTIGGYNIYGR
jgi:hypothetical protein